MHRTNTTLKVLSPPLARVKTPEPSSEGESATYQPTYNTTLMTLLSYLDNTEQVSPEEVCRLVDLVTGTADQDGMASLAGAIVNNYYPKGRCYCLKSLP